MTRDDALRDFRVVRDQRGLRNLALKTAAPPVDSRCMPATTSACVRVVLMLVLAAGVLGTTAACGDPCDEYEQVRAKADREGAYDKYAESLESWRQQCQAKYGQ